MVCSNFRLLEDSYFVGENSSLSMGIDTKCVVFVDMIKFLRNLIVLICVEETREFINFLNQARVETKITSRANTHILQLISLRVSYYETSANLVQNEIPPSKFFP